MTGFINLLPDKEVKFSRALEQKPYLFPEGFSFLFITKSSWTGNLVQLLTTPKPFPRLTLLTISVTNTSLVITKDDGDMLSFDFGPEVER